MWNLKRSAMSDRKKLKDKFPNATLVEVVGGYEIQIPKRPWLSHDTPVVLGKGKTKHGAWKAALEEYT